MRDGNNDNFFGALPDDDVVGEALEDESFCTSIACRAGQVGEGNDFIFK